jgi:chromosome segregation ATPase
VKARPLIEGYIARAKETDRELKPLEKQAKELAKKAAESEEQRTSLEQQIDEHASAIGELRAERTDLETEWISATFESDLQAQRDIQNKRAEIDTAVRGHETELERLSTALEKLPSYEQQGAEIAAGLDMLKQFDGSIAFYQELEQAIRNDTADVRKRIAATRDKLPKYSQEAYNEYRSKVDDDFRKDQDRQAANKEREARLQREKEERRKLTKRMVIDQETGNLKHYEIRDENGTVLWKEEPKKVPLTA